MTTQQRTLHSEITRPAISDSERKVSTDLLSPERAQLLLPELTDDQLATLTSYGVAERTSVGQCEGV